MVDRISAWKASDGTLHATREAAAKRECESALAEAIRKRLMNDRVTRVILDGAAMEAKAQDVINLLMPIAAEVATILSRYVEASTPPGTWANNTFRNTDDHGINEGSIRADPGDPT